MQDAFTVTAAALPASTRVVGFRGTEGLSRPYAFEVIFVLTHDLGDELDLGGAVGTRGTLTLTRQDSGPPFVVNGLFASLELLHDYGGRSVFRAVLVPQLWKLTLSLHSRVFTHKSVPDILKEVLSDAGVPNHELRLLGSYAAEEHVCQYRESDFDFISRWMEREGLYYFFEQGDGEETLIITDDRSSHAPLGPKPVRYFPHPGDQPAPSESLRTFTCRHTSLPSTVRMSDYDYNHPAVEISGTAPVAPNGLGAISLHGARFFTPAEGRHLASVKAQALLAAQVVYHGTGTAFYLRPGYTFDLEEHPRPAFNAAYLITEVEHWGNQTGGSDELKEIIGVAWDEVYRVEVKAVSSKVQYRAPERTAWPRIYGTEHAVVDGAADSEYAQIDEHGRYAIKLSFDESDLRGGQASTWVRMLQPHGGGVEGFHFPLRKGTEVMCTFLGGDPDRPVIAGVAPNALTPSPVTSSNNTKNVIQTGGRNRIEMEDQAGTQRITVSTPTEETMLRMGAPNDNHNFILKTNGTGLIKTGTSLDIETGTWRHDQVKNDMTVDIHGKLTETVDLAVSETYKDIKTEEVTGAVTETYKDIKSETVTKAVTETYKDTQTTTVTNLRKSEHGTEDTTVHGTVTETYEGHYKTTVTTGGRYEEITGLHDQKFHTGWTVNVTGDVKHTATGNYNITADKFKATFSGSWHQHIMGGRVQTTLGALVNLTAGGTLNVVGGRRAEIILGWKDDLVIGKKQELILGVNAKGHLGPEVKISTVKIQKALTRVQHEAIGVILYSAIQVNRAGIAIKNAWVHLIS